MTNLKEGYMKSKIPWITLAN